MAASAPAETAPAEPMAPAQGSAEEQLAQLAGQLLQTLLEQLQDPNAVMAVLQAAMEMLQQSMGGTHGQPVFKKGGKIKKNTKKACGGLMKK